MANDRDDLESELDLNQELALERALDRDEAELSELELTEAQARELAARGDGTLIARAAQMAIERVEKEKDTPDAMGKAITQKYLDMGRMLLRDDHATRLDGRLRQRAMDITGVDPGDVRIHTGERAAEAADALGARAFAVGDSDVFFGRDEYRPDTAEGMGVLVHELAHLADNQVGAAFHSGSGEADFSAAEARAEAAEKVAVQSVGETSEDGAPTQDRLGAQKIDLGELEKAVLKIMERSSRLAADRGGISGA